MIDGVREGEEAMTNKPQVDENTLRTMEALLHQPPKRHDENEVGKA